MSRRTNEARAGRVAARKSWPIRVYRLGEEPGDDISAVTTAAERLAMVWQLTLEAWSLTAKPLPRYSRVKTPVRIVRSRVRHTEPRGGVAS